MTDLLLRVHGRKSNVTGMARLSTLARNRLDLFARTIGEVARVLGSVVAVFVVGDAAARGLTTLGRNFALVYGSVR